MQIVPDTGQNVSKTKATIFDNALSRLKEAEQSLRDDDRIEISAEAETRLGEARDLLESLKTGQSALQELDDQFVRSQVSAIKEQVSIIGSLLNRPSFQNQRQLAGFLYEINQQLLRINQGLSR